MDFKELLEVFASSNKANQYGDLRDTEHLHKIIIDLQNIIQSKDQMISLLGSKVKTWKNQLNVNKISTLKSVSSISNKNY